MKREGEKRKKGTYRALLCKLEKLWKGNEVTGTRILVNHRERKKDTKKIEKKLENRTGKKSFLRAYHMQAKKGEEKKQSLEL